MCSSLAAGCGGSKGTLEVRILVPPDEDVFVSASQVRLSLGDRITTGPVMAGRFDVKIDFEEPPQDQFVTLLLEALDGSGAVIGRGRTPKFVLLPQNSEVTVYVGRSGRVNRTIADLFSDPASMTAKGRREIFAVSLRGRQVSPEPDRGLGILIGGGLDDAGVAQQQALLYDPLTHKVLAAGKTEFARAGAVSAPTADTEVGQQALVWGGAAPAGGNDGMPPTGVELFDPAMSSVATVFGKPQMMYADPGGPPAISPTLSEVEYGTFVLTGGRQPKDAAAKPDLAVNQALRFKRFPAPEGAEDRRQRPGAQRLGTPMGQAGPMVAARYAHTATPVALQEGPGLLLFGGLDPAAMPMEGRPVAEVFSHPRMEFRELKLSQPVPSRRGHGAVQLKDGLVLVLGGYVVDEMGQIQVVDSALVVNPKSGEVSVRDKVLATPRYDMSVDVIAGDVLVCGGFGQDGKVVSTCEVFAHEGGAKAREPFAMPTPRARHLVRELETGQWLFLGGVGVEGKPVAAIDLYTPSR